MIISFDVKLLAGLAVIDGPGFLTLPGRPAMTSPGWAGRYLATDGQHEAFSDRRTYPQERFGRLVLG